MRQWSSSGWFVQIGENAVVLVEDVEVLATDGTEDVAALASLPVEDARAVEHRQAVRSYQGGVRPGGVLVITGRELEAVPGDEVASVCLVPYDLQQVQQLGPVRQREDRGAGLGEQVGALVRQAPAVPVGARVVEDQDVGVVRRVEPPRDGTQGAGRKGVVAVQEQQVVTGRLFDADVAGAAEAHILTEVQDAHARVATGELVHDLAGTVRRAVVDGDDLEVGEVLLQYGVDALPDVSLHVVGRHDECQSRHPSPVQRAVEGPCASTDSYRRNHGGRRSTRTA